MLAHILILKPGNKQLLFPQKPIMHLLLMIQKDLKSLSQR